MTTFTIYTFHSEYPSNQAQIKSFWTLKFLEYISKYLYSIDLLELSAYLLVFHYG